MDQLELNVNYNCFLYCRIENDRKIVQTIGKDKNFIEYCNELILKYMNNGQKACADQLKCVVRRIVDYCGREVKFSQVDREFLSGFIYYLNRDTCRGLKRKPLSSIYKATLFSRVNAALNCAVRDGLISSNPATLIDPGLFPKAESAPRCFLCMEEVRAIFHTEFCDNQDIKSAFLFSCFCGLRYSDLAKLTWRDIHSNADGSFQIETKMKKTRTHICIPLSDNALICLPRRGNANDNQRVFPGLPTQAGNADVKLRKLIRRAGIVKNVTFHVARHTFATMTLFYGADLYTVSKLLGHTNIRTTQIYARIMDRSKRIAVDSVPRI